jgi:geranylgeranyl diphosphate synthase, type I
MKKSNLDDLMAEMIPAVEEEMRSVLCLENAGNTGASEMFGMMQYHMGWVDAEFRPLDVPAGKRIRPVLCLLSCAAAGGDWQQAVPAAAAIELLHNFTLIHDDIQDNSPTRRGRDTVWQIWGVAQAINSGDAMFALAHTALYRLEDRGVDAAAVVEAARRFDRTCVQLTEGQHHDMCFETRDEVAVDEYLHMINGKTAALLALCGELGALVAGASKVTVRHSADFARDLGLAFQVKDDILGIWGDEEAIGKSAATDVETRKKTLPVLYGLEQDGALRALYRQRENGDTFVAEVVSLLDEVGARAYAQQEAERYSTSALHHLEATGAERQAGQALLELANMLLKREA